MKIEINELTFKCIVGILPFERENKQKVIVNLSFNYQFSNNTFIDYSEISALIEKTMKKEKFELLEEAIIYIEKLLNDKYPISNLQLKISKPNILHNCIVSLSN